MIKSTSKLIPLIRKSISKNITENAYQEYFDKYLGKFDGNSSLRCMKEIKELLNEKCDLEEFK